MARRKESERSKKSIVPAAIAGTKVESKVREGKPSPQQTITRHSLVEGKKINGWERMDNTLRGRAEVYAEQRGFGVHYDTGEYFRLATPLERPENYGNPGPHYSDNTFAAQEYAKLVYRVQDGVRNYESTADRNLLWDYLQRRYG
jgi:hypothetical protein